MDSAPVSGKIYVAPGVLVTVAKLAALSVPGVVRMSPVPGGVNQFFRLGANKGVRLETRGESVSAELFVVIRPDADARETGRRIQMEVARAVTEIIGLEVGRIIVHIEDFEASPPEE